uniref:Proteasome activator Blm10 mid region domain-containing protein n=1 Tax=Meloidogyne javanica TaxID=6303 RepID=A0A915MZF0_MELJA
MEEAVIEVESDGSDYEDSDCLSEFSDTESIKFQKTRRLEHLPYYLELEKEANNYFIHVKSGLGYSVSMRDVPGLLYWIRELERKESMVLRCDLKFEWRPLYDLYVRVFLKNFEEDAVSDNFKKILETTIVDCTRYFNDSATREILAEVRPYLCQWDEHFVKGIKILCIFLPVCLTKEENDQFGAKLWIEEILAKDCPGYFDFSPYLDQLFTILMSFFQIEIGVDRIVAITNCSNEFSAFADIFTYSFGMNGDKYIFIPENIKIKDDQIKTFVKSILPCIEYAAFDKQRDYCVPAIIRLLAFLSPEIIVPFVLDLVYSSLQALTEPHRLIQALEILSPVCVVISRHELKYEKKSIWTRILNKIMNIFINREEENEVRGSRWIAIDLMGDLLNELDIYNTEKTQLIFRVLANLMMLIPIVDCSQAPLVCRDLSPEEEQLCAKTASFELFVEELMRKIFSMIDFLGNSVTDRHDLASTKNVGKNMEESVIENGVLIIFRSLVRNCSSTFYNRIADQFFNFVNEHFYNSKPAMDTITKMAGMLVGNDPQVQFARFFNFAVRKFDEHYHADSEAEEEVDRALIWYLNFAAELVRSSSGNIIIENRNLIDPFIEKILRFKSPNIYKLVAIFAHNVLTSICSTYPIPNCLRTRYDQPFDKFLPIRHCAEPINKDHWKINWHIPTIEEVDYASELVNKFITTPLEQLLANFKDTTDKEVLKILKIAHHALMACSHLLPFHNVMPINLIPMAVPNVVLDIVTIRRYVKKIIGPSGSNYRLFLFFIIKQIGEKLLNERENDTKSSIEILYLIRTLTHERGANSTNYRKQLKAFKMVKELTSDPMRGSRTIE